MNFEELQKSWKAQPVAAPENIAALQERLAKQWRKQQRTVLWSNIGVTVGFISTLGVFTWVFITFYKERSILFSGSILFMAALLLVYLWMVWQGIAYKKADFTASSNEYIDGYIKKLNWRRRLITTYNWAYSVLLWAALMLYCFDVTKNGSMALRIGAPLASTIYIFGMQLFMRRTKQKKQIDKIDGMIADMERLKESN